LMNNHSFALGQLDTGLIERERERLFAPEERVPEEMLALACARVLVDETATAGADPWSSRSGWRPNITYTRTITLESERGVHDVDLEYGRDGWHFRHGEIDTLLAVIAASGSRLTLRFADRTLAADVARHGDELHIFAEGRHRMLMLVDVIALAGERDSGDAGLAAPMPGKVIAVNVTKGARVSKGGALLVMEAMKMEHTIVAPSDGVVDEILYGIGDQVKEGAALVVFSPAE
jgi:3-methylcrotonyl-CoA carboxylase alpha subunit